MYAYKKLLENSNFVSLLIPIQKQMERCLLDLNDPFVII